MLATSSKACGLCSAEDPELKFRRFGFDIVQCRGCGLVYLAHRMTPEEISSFYSREYFAGGEDRKGYADYVGDRESLRFSFRRKIEKIERLRRPGRILDIGCAAGYFLEEARDRGWDVYGQEVSAYAGGVARQTLGPDRVFVGHLDAISLPEDSVDVVTMWDVIEHLDEPLEVLDRVRRLLKDGGLLVLCTGDTDSWLARLQGRHSRIFNPPQHLYFYSRRSIAKLLEKSGLQMIDRRVEWKTMSLRYILYVLACVNSNPVTRLLDRLLGRGPAGRLPVRLPLVDNMQVYAVKS